ncbi:DUF7847 domain-containing protein [Haloarchaeobius iranensis]|uniref:DUF7847 domain-containing protein n=1 Tax=Haloarchaeobius iranensis TaxID=996166 RepID=A0A1G9TYJ5_9EURY|nr:hypothetical protein [Haloarchaeobius iranensis]SDM52325.1 hypothetical protein SAMN05192554_103181 [Haloarchaeobius iranensis]
MGAISAAKHAGSTLARNPILFLVATAFAIVQLPQILLQWSGLPIVASLFNLATVVVVPFLIGGIYGMAEEGLDGTTSLATFVRAGRENFVSLLVAAIFFALVVFVVVFVAVVVLAFVTVLTVGVSGVQGGVSPTALIVPGLVGFAFLLLYLATVVFLQFYEAAIVVDDADVFDSLKQSYRFVRGNLLSTIGFTVVRWTPGLLTSLLTAYFVFTSLGIDPDNLESVEPETVQNVYAQLSGTEVGIIVATTLLTAGIVGAFTRTYLVAFYVDHREAAGTVEESADEFDEDLFDDEYDTIG